MMISHKLFIRQQVGYSMVHDFYETQIGSYITLCRLAQFLVTLSHLWRSFQ